ncbi:MAG: hypothetical protein ACRCSN_03710 [Dermatophilaceae bacterium]
MPHTTASETLVSLADVARLTGVRRPVVSMWRQRPRVRGSILPFPAPVPAAGAPERFRLDEVLAWLAATGRGNNPEHEADAARLEPLPTTPEERAALEALLTLGVMTGADLERLEAAELVDLADEADPDDDALLSEIEAAADRLPELAELAARVSESAFGSAAALRLVRGRWASDTPPAVLVDLVASVVHEQLRERPVLKVAGGDLALHVIGALDELDDVVVEVSDDHVGHELARRVRRAAWADGRRTSTGTDAPGVVIAEIPHATTVVEALTEAESVQLDLAASDVAVIVGPARALTDSLDDPGAEATRSDVVRSGRLRCALRLGHGQLTSAHRALAGVWVLGTDQGSTPIAGRWMAAADLTQSRLDDDTVATVVSDIAATLDHGATVAHAYHHARVERLGSVLARRGALVARGVVPRRLAAPPSDRVLEARALLDGLDVGSADHGPGWAAGVRLAPGEGAGTSRSLAELAAAGELAVVRGTRLDLDAVRPAGGTVRVITAADVAQCSGMPLAASASIDPLTLESLAPSARRTRPGDVVFVTGPRPAAAVDRAGRSVVCAPARVLRLDPESLVTPDLLAAVVNAAPSSARDWRAWRVPVHGHHEGLASVLRAYEDERARLAARSRDLDRLTDLLTSGDVTVAATDDHPTTRGQ